jgi:hypothetical protein
MPLILPGDVAFEPQTWDELFDFKATIQGVEKAVVEHLETLFSEAKRVAIADHQTNK